MSDINAPFQPLQFPPVRDPVIERPPEVMQETFVRIPGSGDYFLRGTKVASDDSVTGRSLEVYISEGKIRITPGVVAGAVPTYFGGTPQSAAVGYVYAKLTLTVPVGTMSITNAHITARDIIFSAAAVSDTATTFHFPIADITKPASEFVVTQLSYGPINATVFRDWYDDSPSARVAFFGS